MTTVSVKCQVQTVCVRVLSQTCELLGGKLKELIILHSVISELLSDLSNKRKQKLYKTLSLGSLCLQSSRSFDQPAMFDWELKSTVGGGVGKGE